LAAVAEAALDTLAHRGLEIGIRQDDVGDLPPSSWATRFTVSAAVLATMMPARVDPVKETMSTPGWPAMTWPTEGPSPLIML
jgi:hypothetical protein